MNTSRELSIKCNVLRKILIISKIQNMTTNITRILSVMIKNKHYNSNTCNIDVIFYVMFIISNGISSLVRTLQLMCYSKKVLYV